ncbi:hypothetical protein [Sinorhizobium sojae]|uniref:hypothetical protein n=1 Tax=Sinorhizobium sojae TaxID=716925 RepID=UPI000550DE73|nr:hypothetical protein [Sinorhizobium sojae]
MIDLATATVIAKMASDAVGAFDKIFRGFADVVAKKEPTAPHVPPPDFVYIDSPEQKAFVAKSRKTGATYQTVTYQTLCETLSGGDREYIETLTRAMENYQRQWNSAFEQRSLASGMDVGRMDAQLDYLARQIADCLIKVLDFVGKMGLHLDDHYSMARHVAGKYLARA